LLSLPKMKKSKQINPHCRTISDRELTTLRSQRTKKLNGEKKKKSLRISSRSHGSSEETQETTAFSLDRNEIAFWVFELSLSL
jgi:hypothetical protein